MHFENRHDHNHPHDWDEHQIKNLKIE